MRVPEPASCELVGPVSSTRAGRLSDSFRKPVASYVARRKDRERLPKVPRVRVAAMSTRADQPRRRAAESRSPRIFPLCSRVLPRPTVLPSPRWVGVGGGVVGTASATILAMSGATVIGALSALVSGSCPSLAGCPAGSRANVARRSRKRRAGPVRRPNPGVRRFRDQFATPGPQDPAMTWALGKALENLSKTSRKTLVASGALARAFQEFSERPWRQPWGRHALGADRCPHSGRFRGGTFRLPSLHLPPFHLDPCRQYGAGGIQAEQGAERRRNRGGTGPTHPAAGLVLSAAEPRKLRGRYAEGATRRITRTEEGPAGPGKEVEVMNGCSTRVGGDALPGGGGRP